MLTPPHWLTRPKESYLHKNRWEVGISSSASRYHPTWDLSAWALRRSTYPSSASELGSYFVPLRINTCRREFTIDSQGWKCLCKALNKVIWPCNFLVFFFSCFVTCFSATTLFSSYHVPAGTHCTTVSLDWVRHLTYLVSEVSAVGYWSVVAWKSTWVFASFEWKSSLGCCRGVLETVSCSPCSFCAVTYTR